MSDSTSVSIPGELACPRSTSLHIGCAVHSSASTSHHIGPLNSTELVVVPKQFLHSLLNALEFVAREQARREQAWRQGRESDCRLCESSLMLT